MINGISIFQANKIELHYCFNDNTHCIDAEVLNQCDRNFIEIAKEVASKLKIKINIETEPLGNGGIISWFNFISNNQISTSIIIQILVSILVSPLNTTISFAVNNALKRIFKRNNKKQLEKKVEELKLEVDILKLQSEKERLSKTIDENKIKKCRSNYYEIANNYSKIQEITISITDKYKQPINNRNDILKTDFPRYIMTSDDIDSENDEHAIIEIVSPVLKKGKYGWSGIYNSNLIYFNMGSSEFNFLVQKGQVSFKNGFSIDCNLKINKKMDNEGNVKIKNYEVICVNKYFENDKPIETIEGIKKRQLDDAKNRQSQLNFKY